MQGVGANFANDRGVRPMHMACQAGDMAVVQRLLELGEIGAFTCPASVWRFWHEASDLPVRTGSRG